jgi:hypothetical protein
VFGHCGAGVDIPMKQRFWNAMLDFAMWLNALTERFFLYCYAHARPRAD